MVCYVPEGGRFLKKLMIADSSSVFISALEKALKNQYEIRTCCDGDEVLDLLAAFQPDILIINLILPHTDGITALQKACFRPSIILATTPYLCRYIEQAISELGVDFTMICPSVKSLMCRLDDLVRCYTDIPDQQNLNAMTIHHLRMLNFPSHLDGFQYLCVALPLYVQEPQQLLTKELYPRIALLFGSQDGRAVERSIRKAIYDAWSHRDNTTWRKYFIPGPKGEIACPSNKAFICRLAELLITGAGVL